MNIGINASGMEIRVQVLEFNLLIGSNRDGEPS